MRARIAVLGLVLAALGVALGVFLARRDREAPEATPGASGPPAASESAATEEAAPPSAAASAAPTARALGRVEVRVTRRSGAPAPGLRVNLVAPEPDPSRTDWVRATGDDGRVAWDDLAPGDGYRFSLLERGEGVRLVPPHERGDAPTFGMPGLSGRFSVAAGETSRCEATILGSTTVRGRLAGVGGEARLAR